MNQQEALWGNPVTSLQTMLRQLSQVYPFLPAPPLDGIFGESTLETVLIYQRERFPPVTGVVDHALWKAIREDYAQHRPNQSSPRLLRAFPERQNLLHLGEKIPSVGLIQMMFQLLSEKIEGIQPDSPSGEYTTALAENVRWLQTLSGLPSTGILDRQSWDRLSRLYEGYVTAEF